MLLKFEQMAIKISKYCIMECDFNIWQYSNTVHKPN